ncbi:hypothetical protein [Nocardia transvalensis]|uniref:hypothetical protein n=1 Tax=Nocardia transvalensis TaxID=37333 RepID=UPI001894267B|nr:hypothetical protein [Nocardia transvalensis]MBF6328041.1 hypothetical protein [Nocardia transvalensis]
MRRHLPAAVGALAMLLWAPATALAAPAAPAGEAMPQPDLCTRSIPLGNVEVVQKRALPAGERCADYETSAYSPQAQQEYLDWWNRIVDPDSQQSSDSQDESDSQQGANSQQGSGQQSQGSNGQDQSATQAQ